MRYIEENPKKAKIVNDIKDYNYSSYHQFLDIENISKCLKYSWIIENFENKKDIESLIQVGN